jgi:FkbM family methyltransferase
MTTPRDLSPESKFWGDLSHLLPPSPVIIDLGAHLLEEASILLPRLINATWCSVEANPDLIRSCQDRSINYAQNGNSLQIYNYAIAPKSGGTITLHRSKMKNGQSWTPSSSTHRPSGTLIYFPWMVFEDTIEVPAISLDDLCQVAQLQDKIHLLKMDIQGAEIDAVLGGQLTLSRTKYVLTEVVNNMEYEGQATLTELMASLPGRWRIVEHLLTDALLENIS